MKAMRYIWIWSFFLLPVCASAQQIDVKIDADSIRRLAGRLEKDLKQIKISRLKQEAKVIGGSFRQSLRANLNSPETTPQVTVIRLATNEGSAEGIDKAPKTEANAPKTSNPVGKTGTEKKNNIEPRKAEEKPVESAPEQPRDLWAEMNRRELDRIAAEEKSKESELLALQRALELQIRANELQTLRQTNWILGGGAVVAILLFSTGFLVRSNRIRKRNNKLLAEEKSKSDMLLLNILPASIAHELKSFGKAQPRQYKTASVLFTDFKGFTNVAEKMTPHELIAELDECFARFDEIITQHRLEKIKTIGDAYMCVGGIPEENQTNPIDAILAGLSIQQFMTEKHAERLAEGKEYWSLRLGINTGEVVAGVIGKKKFAYDVWGDTVNLASRMESSGAIGKVNISENTYHYAQHLFVCTHRGQVDAKNKGAVDMYFVEGILPEYSLNGAGKEPNDAFWKKWEEMV